MDAGPVRGSAAQRGRGAPHHAGGPGSADLEPARADDADLPGADREEGGGQADGPAPARRARRAGRGGGGGGGGDGAAPACGAGLAAAARAVLAAQARAEGGRAWDAGADLSRRSRDRGAAGGEPGGAAAGAGACADDGHAARAGDGAGAAPAAGRAGGAQGAAAQGADPAAEEERAVAADQGRLVAGGVGGVGARLPAYHAAPQGGAAAAAGGGARLAAERGGGGGAPAQGGGRRVYVSGRDGGAVAGPGAAHISNVVNVCNSRQARAPLPLREGAVGCAMHGAKLAACGRGHASPWPDPDRERGGSLLQDAKSGTRGWLPRAARPLAPSPDGEPKIVRPTSLNTIPVRGGEGRVRPGVRTPYAGSSPIRASILPKLRPLNTPASASGAFSSPFTMSSR